MKTTVIHHDADYDGLFCREIAKKFLPGAHLIGWDFGRPKLDYPENGLVFVMDLPPHEVFKSFPSRLTDLTVLDHHKTSLEKLSVHPFCIDGVAACRLAWQFFTSSVFPVDKAEYVNRKVVEPYAVTLAGEYDVWDHGASAGKDVDFQFGLSAEKEIRWPILLMEDYASRRYVTALIENGEICHQYVANRAGDVAIKRGFDLKWEGLLFRAINTARTNSLFFEKALRPEHDACLSYYWNGTTYIVSMYGTYKDIDLSQIAKKYGGGGHKKACGFQTKILPWEISYAELKVMEALADKALHSP